MQHQAIATIDVCVERTPELVEDGSRALRCHNPVEVTR